MPTYDFRCTNPVEPHQVEVMQAMDAPNPDCEQCGMPTVKVPSFRGHVMGDTPKFFPNRK